MWERVDGVLMWKRVDGMRVSGCGCVRVDGASAKVCTCGSARADMHVDLLRGLLAAYNANRNRRP